MMDLMILVLVPIVILLSCEMAKSSQIDATSPKCPRLVCYFSNEALYRHGDGRISINDIDTSKCTHIVYSFATLDGNKLAPTDVSDVGTELRVGNYEMMMRHKVANPNLKVILAVGGWSMGSTPFTAMVATPESRKEFVDSTIDFLKKHGFDGLELSWQFPTRRGSPSIDKDRFTMLCQELMASFITDGKESNKARLLLTAAVAAGVTIIDDSYDVRALNNVIDFFNVLAYDLHGGWDKVTGNNSPLYKGSWESGMLANYNVESAVAIWLNRGASKDKIVIGLPFSARSFKLASFDSGIGSSVSGFGTTGPYTQKDGGFLAYYEVCIMQSQAATMFFSREQRVPYLVLRDRWVSYDNPKSLSEKVRFARDHRLGGVMVFDLSLDDVHGKFCNDGESPLIKTVSKQCFD